jgi:hypothetical protein
VNPVSKKAKPIRNSPRWVRNPKFKERIPEAVRVQPNRPIPKARYRVIRYANPRVRNADPRIRYQYSRPNYYWGIRPFGWSPYGVYYRGRFTSGVW